MGEVAPARIMIGVAASRKAAPGPARVRAEPHCEPTCQRGHWTHPTKPYRRCPNAHARDRNGRASNLRSARAATKCDPGAVALLHRLRSLWTRSLCEIAELRIEKLSLGGRRLR